MVNNIKIITTGLLSLLLFSGATYSAEKTVLLKTTETWDNTKLSKMKIKNPEVTVLNITIDVGEELPMHKHDMVNIAYVKKGTLTVITDKNKQITVKEGQCLSEIIGKYHYGKNAGNTPVELIVFYIGEKDTPLSVNKK